MRIVTEVDVREVFGSNKHSMEGTFKESTDMDSGLK
jgi:hypothetical protein